MRPPLRPLSAAGRAELRTILGYYITGLESVKGAAPGAATGTRCSLPAADCGLLTGDWTRNSKSRLMFLGHLKEPEGGGVSVRLLKGNNIDPTRFVLIYNRNHAVEVQRKEDYPSRCTLPQTGRRPNELYEAHKAALSGRSGSFFELGSSHYW